MISKYIKKIDELKKYVGKKVTFLILFTTCMGFLGFLIESSFILIIQGFLISIGIDIGSDKFLPNWYPRGLLANIFILVAFGVLRGLAMFMRAYFAGNTGVMFINNKRAQILEKALFAKQIQSVSTIMDTLGNKIFNSGTVLQEITQILYLSCLSFCLMVLGFYIAPVEFVISIFFFTLILFNQKYIQKEITRVSHGIWASWKVVYDTLYWGLQNNFLIKIYGLERSETNKAQQKLNENQELYKSYYKVIGLRAALTNISGIAIISALSYLSISILKTDPLKLLGLFYLFMRLSGSMTEINGHLNSIRLYWPNFMEVKNYLEDFKQEQVTISEKKSDEKMANIQTINIKNLSFSYDKNKNLINNISFNLKTSDTLLIKGESGCGKSTLLSLLFGVQKPDSGEIFYNNLPIDAVKGALPEKIGYVGPDPFLLNGTVKENLLYANQRSEVSEAELWDVLKDAQLDSLIASLPNGLSEYLNEQTQMSTGQKQRMAIARALLRKPDILILDEATANLDKMTEQKIIEAVRLFSKSRIVIVISHKDSFDSIASVTINLSQSTDTTPVKTMSGPFA